MTIEYKDSKRIVALSTDVANTATFEDDFSGADNWTDSDSTYIGVNTSTDVLDFRERDGNFDEVSYYGITALGTDANFTLRLKLNIGTITQTGNTDSVRTLIGISSDNDIPTGTARDEVGIIWRVTDTINKFYAFTADGIALPNSGTDFATTPSTTGGDGSGNYYVEIIGDSGTYTFKLYSDSSYSTLIESETITDAGITGLDNIVIRSSTLTTTNNQARGYIDDVEFWSGSTTNKPTNVQNNSLLVEKDVARRYWFSEATTPTFESDFSSSTGWTTVGSNISITGGVIQASSMATQSDNRIYYDLGSALSDQFVIDFDHYADSASSGGFWGMFALTDTTSIPKTDDSIHALIDMGSWNTYLRYSNEGSETNLALAGSLTTGQWQYIRFVRDGTTGTFYVYSDSDRTNQVLSATGTIPTTVTGLRYFQSGAILSGNSGTTTYKIDNLKVYDGVTSVSGDTWNMQPTLEDDFSTDNFVQTGTEIDVSGGELVWDANPDNTTTGGYIDFGENLSDTAWVCRFKVKVNNYSGAVTTATNFYIQFQNITTVNSTTSRDSMGIHLRLKSGSTDWRVEAVDGAVAGGGAGNLIDGSATTETIYVQMYRDGNTIYAEWYDNADYTGTPTNTANHSSGTPANLRYFAVYRRSDVATTGVSNGIIDDLEIYNGVTSIN